VTLPANSLNKNVNFSIWKKSKKWQLLPRSGPQLPQLSWHQLIPKLLAVGWTSTKRPGEYLKKLERHWYIDHIIDNPRKVALRIAWANSPSDWDDIIINHQNQNKGFQH